MGGKIHDCADPWRGPPAIITWRDYRRKIYGRFLPWVNIDTRVGTGMVIYGDFEELDAEMILSSGGHYIKTTITPPTVFSGFLDEEQIMACGVRIAYHLYT